MMEDYILRGPVMSQANEKVLDALLYQKRTPKLRRMKMTKAPTTFPNFTLLPYELQDMIWEYAASAIPSRTIELRTVEIEKPGRLEECSQYIYVNDLMLGMARRSQPRHTHTFGSPTPPPALLSVSYHARAVAKRHYEFAFRPINPAFRDPDNLTKPPYVDLIDRDGLACPDCTCCTHGIWVDFSKDIFVPGSGVFGNEVVTTEWADDFIADLYDIDVFHGSRESIHKIQRLALPLMSLWTKNTVTWHLGFLPGVKEVMLVRTRGWDKKAEMELHGREVVPATRFPHCKDDTEDLITRGGWDNHRVCYYLMKIREAKAVAEMLFERKRLTVQDARWMGPGQVSVSIARVKKKKGDSRIKIKAKEVWETVKERGLMKWIEMTYDPRS